MGRPKLGTEYKKPADYTYDYPKNRQIGDKLHHGDMLFIAKTLGYSGKYVAQVLKNGERNNEKIKTIAGKLIAMRDEIINS